MASATELTASAALIVAVGGVVTPWLSARLKAKPDAQAALNDGVRAFIAALQKERSELQAERKELREEVDKLHILVGDWETKFHQAMEWADLLADRLQKHERLPERPKFNGHARP